MYIVYAILNKHTGSYYVGRTRLSLRLRMNTHYSARHKTHLLAVAMRSHGKQAFEIRALVECPSVGEADAVEKMAISFFKSNYSGKCYNQTDGGPGSSGLSVSSITRSKLSKINSGKKLSDEVKIKIGLAHRGSKRSLETRRRMSVARTGYVMPESTKRKLSKINMGNTVWLGRKHTEYTKSKISEANRGRKKPPISDATRRRMSEAAKKRHRESPGNFPGLF